MLNIEDLKEYLFWEVLNKPELNDLLEKKKKLWDLDIEYIKPGIHEL